MIVPAYTGERWGIDYGKVFVYSQGFPYISQLNVGGLVCTCEVFFLTLVLEKSTRSWRGRIWAGLLSFRAWGRLKSHEDSGGIYGH